MAETLREVSANSYQPLLRTALALSTGIVADRMLSVSIAAWLAGSLLAVFVWFGLNFHPRKIRSGFLVALMVVGLGGFWHNLNWNWYGNDEISSLANLDASPVALRGKVVSQPKWISPDPLQEKYSHSSGIRSRMLVEVTEVRQNAQFVSASGRVEIFVSEKLEGINKGERIEVTGKLSRIGPATNPGSFDFQNYFRGRRTLCWMTVSYAECVTSLGAVRGPLGWMSGLRINLDKVIWDSLSEEYAPLASAMLLGNRTQLDRMEQDAFLLSGTVHLLAISGLHVGILAGLFLLLPRLDLLSRRKSLLLTVAFVCFYAWLVEFRPPVVRASILITVFCYCRLAGRVAFSMNTLAFAAILVLAINPSDLFSAGAQLSFLAVGSMIFGRHWLTLKPSDDPIDKLIARTRPTHVRIFHQFENKLFTAFAVSGLIWFVAAPLVASRFHVVAPIALFVNPLLLIPVTTGLAFGFGLLVFGPFIPPLGFLMARGCEASLWCIQQATSSCQSWSLGHFWTTGPPFVSVLVLYAILLIVFILWRKMPLRYFVTLATVWALFGWVVPDWNARQEANARESLSCTFVEVGHGTCVLLELPKGKNILYDCGSFGRPRNAQQNAASVLWDRGIRKLDTIVISHADSDHFNGIPSLVKQFRVQRIVISAAMQQTADESPMIKNLLAEFDERAIPIQIVSAGDQVEAGLQTRINVLTPPKTGFGESDNANSIVLEVCFSGRRILLPGDIEKSGLDALLKTRQEPFDVVMAPHHGSKESRPVDFVQWSKPQYVVVSSGRSRNIKYASLLPEDHRPKVFHTGRDGAVRVDVQEKQIVIRNWLNDPWE